MAYSVSNSGDKYLYTTSAPVSSSPYTAACWFYTTSLPSTSTPATLIHLGSRTLNPGSVLSIRGNDESNKMSCGSWDGSVFRQSNTTGAPSTSVWNHACGVWASSTSKTVYLNGSAGTQQTGSTNEANVTINSLAFGAVGRATPVEEFSGEIAEIGIWNVALTAAEVASLADGMTCDKVRPQSLVFYAPLVRDLIDVKGARAITNNNTATVANHPRVYA